MDKNNEDYKIDIGQKLRIARIRKRLTLKDVARKAEISESFLSQLERGRSSASIATIKRVTDTLETTLSQLFDENDETDIKIIRKTERPSLKYGILGRKSLLTPATLKNLEVLIGVFDEGGSTGEELYCHGDSEELLYVLSGFFEAQIGEQVFILSEGDCINYRSSIGHRVENIGSERGEVLWIISPPSI